MQQFRKIEDGILLGPQPTEQDLREAKQYGIRTVVDFRMPNETPIGNAELAARCDLGYVNIPVNKTSLTTEQIDELDRAMEDKSGPFLIHCASGARAAMLLSLRKARKHRWNAERTFEEARAMGFDLKTSPEFSAFVADVTSNF